VARARKLAGIKTANLVEYEPVMGLANLLRIFGKAQENRVKVDVGIEMPKLRAGYLYFLAPTYLL
jgi:hypothetical protein